MDISFLLEKLSNLVLQEAAIFGEVEGQVRLLRNELEWMRLVLEDADGRRIQDKRLKIWVNQIREAAYDAEDVIDDFMFKVEHQQQQRLDHLKVLRFLPTCVTFADKLSFVHELDARVKEINVTIEKILANKSRYNIESPTFSDATASSMEVEMRREKWPPIDREVDIVGRKDDAQAVTRMLVVGEKRRKVVAIVGMGGLGKTAISKKVFYLVKPQFDCAALVSVSHEYRIQELFISIANAIMVDLSTEKRNEMTNMVENQLAREVSNYLKDKRYLIVLDDVWSTKVWDGLDSYFPKSNRSCRVLITTRDEEIAAHAYAIIYRPQPLDNEESWELFVKRTFHIQSSSTESVVCPEELENLGRSITAKCRGLPLPIVVVGDFLSRKPKTGALWSKILHDMEWLLSQGPDSCYGILGLSYLNYLPHSLKYCFLYFGTFPKDWEIEAKKLIQLWISEGLVQPRGKETMEDVAEEYLESLIRRSMIQVGKRRSNGKVKSCRIHDVLHDLAISIARDSKFFEVSQNSNFISPVCVRRLIVHDHGNYTAQHLQSLRLRSIICSLDFHAESLKSFVGAKLLTVLDLTITGHHKMKQLPKEVGQLIHLKYFSLRGATLVRFPRSIGRLLNLRILDLETSIILSIPCSIWKLHQLRYLHSGYSWISNHSIMERCLSGHLGVHQLTNLRTLHLRPDSWLEISCTLEKLTQLQVLNLYEGVIKSSYKLRSPSLVKLKLEYCKLEQDPMLTLDNLPKLIVLKLIECEYLGRKMTCSSERFPLLHSLRLVALSELQELQVEDGAMPVLKTLQIAKCPKMKKLPHALLQLKNLQLLELEEMASDLIEEIRTTDGEEFDKIRLITKVEGNFLVRLQD